ncbi:glycosyltransferase [Phragmitibacter flavus]|uniref:Glycosyltransferase n=1 Tax=Phragmitibacter flavus TaxID=2576071 RepID=A0A5R8KBH7_9BACT|nr:glycosyltransferase [Phragmitibacter flavus]TLD69658.1 glycosyltransferase [Phragmitibacter flavus]
MSRRIVEVFNRYAFYGGEEKVADQIAGHLTQDHELLRCGFDSREWMGEGAPGKLSQVRRLFYNGESRERFEAAVREFKPEVAMFHNVYPVGSPSLYHAAQLKGLPVVQYVHNFRPFSVGGSLYLKGKLMPGALKGSFWPEVLNGAWQGSVLKSALMALALKRLRTSGWLDQVKVWVCISEFMRDRFAEAGIDERRLVVLKHAWEPKVVETGMAEEGDGYLFLGRLVEEKGVRVLLEAWERLWKEMGEATPELWIGGEGPLEDEVRAAAAGNPRVRYLGMLAGDEKSRRLRECRALLAPSVWWEPLGLVVYEAYEAGRPVLAAASGGLTETVKDGVTGWLHPAGDVGALVDSVRAMEQIGEEGRSTMGREGRKWLEANTGVEGWKREMALILEKAIEG